MGRRALNRTSVNGYDNSPSYKEGLNGVNSYP